VSARRFTRLLTAVLGAGLLTAGRSDSTGHCVDGIISDYPERALRAAPRGVPSWMTTTMLAAGVGLLAAAVLPVWRLRSIT
jgi:hypothetical protein